MNQEITDIGDLGTRIVLHRNHRRFRAKANPILHHFSETDDPLELIPFRERAERKFQEHKSYPTNSVAMKPWGALWLSDESDFGWVEWSVIEEFQLERLRYEWEIRMNWDQVCHLATPEDIDDFSKMFAAQPYPQLPSFLELGSYLDWSAIARRWDAVIVTPYQWSRRLKSNCSWYYGWDCAGGAILHPRAVAEVGPPRDARPRVERLQKKQRDDENREFYEIVEDE